VRLNKDSDILIFNEALCSINNWATEWQLPISFTKCNVMRISNTKPQVAEVVKLGTHELGEIEEIKDLGVLFTNNLNFSDHITSVIVKAKQRLFLLHKSFLTKDAEILIKAYKTYVLPILEYCSQIWSPHHVNDINRLESVQRLFTKRLQGFQNMSYSARLRKANLCSLELRRKRADLLFCYKILHGITVMSNVENMFTVDKTCRTRGHCWKLKTENPRLDTRRFFFAHRTAIIWNSLKSETVNASSANEFKNLLLIENISAFLTNDFDNQG
jgi:hypothetical protein